MVAIAAEKTIKFLFLSFGSNLFYTENLHQRLIEGLRIIRRYLIYTEPSSGIFKLLPSVILYSKPVLRIQRRRDQFDV